MKKLLHIIATPRNSKSRTLKVSESFLHAVHKKYPTLEIDHMHLFAEALPDLNMKMIEGKYILMSCLNEPSTVDASAEGRMCRVTRENWQDVEHHIERFLAADAYLITVPMWNFSIPYVLKHYIDVIVQPSYLFTYTPQGPKGLVCGKKMVVVTSRGGYYGQGSPFQGYDHQESYLKTIFSFIGIADIQFVHAESMDVGGKEVQQTQLLKAQTAAKKIAEAF